MSLWLGRNHITDKGVELFSELLLGHKNKIKEFSIGGETMSDMGAYCIAKTIHEMDEKGYRYKKDRQKRCKEYLEFWLNSVYMHASEAAIIIVGTYLDAFFGTEAVLEVNAFINGVIGERFNAVIVSNGQLSFFPLSNKHSRKSIKGLALETGRNGVEGSNIDTIPDSIERVARKQDFVNQKLSLKWIKCLDLMLNIRKKSFITYKKVLKLAASCGVHERSDVDNMLKFFHELGMIVHLTSTESLKEVITIKPQWLIDELSKVIRDKRLHKYNRDELNLGVKRKYCNS